MGKVVKYNGIASSRLVSEIEIRQQAGRIVLLPCNVCGQAKSVDGFGICRKWGEKSDALSYETRCKDCTALRGKLSKGKDGMVSNAEVQAFLGTGAKVAPPLKQARHAPKPARTIPLTVKERAALAEMRRKARLEREAVTSYCYLVGMEGDNSSVKIGHAIHPESRLSDYQAGNPRKLVLLAKIPGGEAKERELHTKFAHLQRPHEYGEWFPKMTTILHEFGIA